MTIHTNLMYSCILRNMYLQPLGIGTYFKVMMTAFTLTQGMHMKKLEIRHNKIVIYTFNVIHVKVLNGYSIYAYFNNTRRK
jgi:hypothetical protein